MRRVLDSALGHKGHGHLNKARSATPVCCARRHVGMHVHGAMWCICSPCVGHQARFPSPPQLPLPHTARGWVFRKPPFPNHLNPTPQCGGRVKREGRPEAHAPPRAVGWSRSWGLISGLAGPYPPSAGA